MTIDPKNPTLPPMLESAVGPIPWQHWDNDQRCPDDAMIDTGPGSVYDALTQRGKAYWGSRG